MYRKIEPPLRMSGIEASEMFPDEYILARKDDRNPCRSSMRTVLYVGDDFYELLALLKHFDDPNNCGVFEGVNHMRKVSLGGIVVGT